MNSDFENSPVTINLRSGEVSTVDIDDSDLANIRWGSLKSGHNCYANGTIDGKPQYMHRVVMSRMLGRELKRHDIVDHINGNSLDNRRTNLRLATHQQNIRNQRRSQRNTSGFKGVDFFKHLGKWRARLRVNRKHVHIGYFDTPEAAYEAYCIKAKEVFGEFARFE